MADEHDTHPASAPARNPPDQGSAGAAAARPGDPEPAPEQDPEPAIGDFAHRNTERAPGNAPEQPQRAPLPVTQTDGAIGPDEQTDKAQVQDRLPLASSAVIAQYELIRELGSGGHGTVFLARDVRLGRRVAIKFLAQGNPLAAERFLTEARATARCKHDSIVDIYDVGEVPGYSYMVLEYLDGITLRRWLKQRWQTGGAASTHIASASAPPPVSPALAIEMMLPVVRALAYAHSLGLVHRDLKPENIMLTESGSIKVLDFGIAKVLGKDAVPLADTDDAEQWGAPDFHTREGTIVGTMPYMSPEQWGADDVDERSDIWAMGIILAELVLGRHPLAPLTPAGVMTVGNLDIPMPLVRDQQPDPGPLGAVIDRCLRKCKADRIPSAKALLTELELLAPGPKTAAGHGPSEPESPFAGLAAFQEIDAGRFFGRDRDIVRVMGLVRNHRIVTVAGPSGAGKSSFVRAGLIPALKRLGQGWEALIVRPGRQPLAALADALAQLSPARAPGRGHLNDQIPDAVSREALISRLRDQPGYLGTALRAHCRRWQRRVLLFVDQFEELYTLGADRDTRASFTGCLEGAADDVSSPLRVVLSLRSDFLDRVAEDRATAGEITRGLLLLPPMGREELRQAVTRPVEMAGYQWESEDMVETVLDALEATRSPLPLLQFSATLLWDARDRDRKLFTRASYEQMGGVAGALATHADAVLASLSAAEQRLARAVFLRLVTEERTRAVVTLAELRPLAEDHDAVAHVVNHLASARLVLLETDGERGGSTVELVHESLIDRWPRLARWLDEDAEDAQFRARLAQAAKQWDAQGRSDDVVWRGQAAEDAERWLARSGAKDHEKGAPHAAATLGLGAREIAYLRAVAQLAARARRRRRRMIAAAFALVSAIALVVSLLALRARQEAARAEEQARRADAQARRAEEQATRADAQAARAQAEAVQARNAGRMAAARELMSDPTAVLAVVREIEPGAQPRGWSELAHWALQSGVAHMVFDHEDWLFSAAFSPDGTRIVSASLDKTARLWKADGSGLPLVLRGHQAAVLSAAFSPDGTRIVTASQDMTARVWNADGSGLPLVLSGHQDIVISAAFSPDGKRIVTASADKTVRLWNADGSGLPLVLRGHQNRVLSAAFSPDGKRIVSASDDKTVRLWNADGSGLPLVLRGHQDVVVSAAFSPNGDRIVTASYDKTVRLWNADGSGVPVVLRGHENTVVSAAFSPSGDRIVTASYDKTVRLWNADGYGQPLVLRGHRDLVSSAAFSPEGTRIVTASRDKTVRVWNADGYGQPLVLRGHQGRVNSVAFSPNGDRIVTASDDKTVRLWNADGSGMSVVLRGHQDIVISAAFSPDGTRIVTASQDKTVRLWNADGSGQPIVLRGYQSTVYFAAFSPDGTRIATASQDKTVRLWNADGTGQPLILRGHQEGVFSADFSPDGTRIVTASDDKTVRLWNADGTGQPLILRGHQEGVLSAAFSPDGTRIVTASQDKTVRLWNADGTGQLLILRGHQEGVLSAAFSPDGTRIVTASYDKTVRVWNADGTGEFLVLRGLNADFGTAAFSPDGKRIAAASTDGTAWIWSDLSPLTGADDPRLWTATSYCMTIELRQELLDVSEDMARADQERCLQRVDQARAAAREAQTTRGGLSAPARE